MKYDFETIINRKGKDAVAFDGIGLYPGTTPDFPGEGFDAIPMWIADMNFKTAPSVTEALLERIQHPLYGYFLPKDEYFDSIIRWHETRHKTIGLKREAIGYENGVHGCITSCVQTLSQPGEAIFLHTPYYMGFSGDIDALGRVPVYSELRKDKNGIYRMDFEDMEEKIQANNCHLAVLCSPHNPAGRVWERWELEKAMEIFERNEVYVISDEIWADITYTGHQHIPTQMVNEWAKQYTVAVYATSKTFNLAGMVGSYHVIYNKMLRDRITHTGFNTHYNEQNILSMHALIGAYSEGGNEWTNELLQVLEHNARYLANYLNGIEGLSVTRPEGTYMMFLDCTAYCKRTGRTITQLLKAGYDVGVGWQNGAPFGGSCHIRLNVALPFSRLKEAVERLDKYVFNV